MALTTANIFSGGNFAANKIAVRPPALTGLKTWVFPRLSPGPSNLIASGPALLNYGLGPDLQTAWGNFAYNATVANNKAYDPQVVDATEATLMSVAWSPGGSGGFALFDNYQPSGVAMWLDNFSNALGLTIIGSLQQTVSVPVPGGTILNWMFYAVTFGPLGVFVYIPTLGIAWNVTYQIRINTLGGSGSTISVTATGAFAGSPVTKVYMVQASDTAATASAALAALVNADPTLQAAGITAIGGTGTTTFIQSPATAYTFVASASAGVAAAQASTTLHIINATANYKVGSVINSGSRGTGSIAWFAAATGPGSQATPAQINQTYLALQASLALDGINI